MKNLGKKMHEMAVFIEFIAGSGLAIFFHMALHHEQAAYMIFGMGILLSLVTYLVREDVEKSRNQLLAQYQQVHEIPFALAADAPSLPPDAPGSAALRVGGQSTARSPLEAWLDLLFGPQR